MLAYGTITISDEMRGSGIYKITTAPSSYTTTTGGFTPTYRIALSTVKSQAGVTEVLIGDILEQSYYHYPVGYVDGSYVYLGPRVSIRGATGASATAYSLIVSHAAIVKAEDGTYTFDKITITAKSQSGTGAMANYTGRLVIETTTDNSTWTNRYNQDAATYTYTIPSGIVAVRCSLYVAGGTATLLDQQIVPVVSDGASGGKGEDAYTVILTNENHTFAGGTSAALAGSTTCNVVAYKGATQVAATIGTISGAPTGMSTTITSNGTTSAYFTVTVTTSMVTKNGVLTVPVTVDGKSFSMKFSYSLALAGVSVTNVTSTNNTQDGGTSVVTVTLSDGTTKTFNVKNGNKGSTGATAQWFYGTALTHTSGTATASVTGAVVGSMYLNTTTSLVYKCTAISGSTMTWAYAGDLTTGVINNIDVGGRNYYIIKDSVEGFLNSSGNISAMDVVRKEHTSDFISVIPGEALILQVWATHPDDNGLWLAYCFYDSSKTLVGSRPSKTSNGDHLSFEITVPTGVSYIRVSARMFDDGRAKLERGNIATDWTPAPEDVESDISNAQNTADIALSQSVEYIIGTQTAVTGAWTGVSSIMTELKDGAQIRYWLPFAGSGNATLNLTLKDGTTTGAIPIYRQGGSLSSGNVVAQRVTTHYPTGSVIPMTYGVNRAISVVSSGTTYTGHFTGWFVDGAYDSGNTYNRVRLQNAIKAETAITSGRIICGTASGYKNIAANISFDLSYPLLWAGSNIAASKTGDGNYLSVNGVNASSNGTITSGAANKTLFLKGTITGNLFKIAASPFMTTVEATSNDGFYYIPLGLMYNATSIYFQSLSRLYAYIDGSFQPVDTAAVLRAAEAKKVATNYMSSDTTGVMVADLADGEQKPATATGRNVRITNTAVEVRDGQDVKASFGETVVIGESDTTRVEISSDDTTFYGADNTTVGQIANGTSADEPHIFEIYYEDDFSSDISGKVINYTDTGNKELGTVSTFTVNVVVGNNYTAENDEEFEFTVTRNKSSSMTVNSDYCPMTIAYTYAASGSSFKITIGTVPDYTDLEYIYVEGYMIRSVAASNYSFGKNITNTGRFSFAEGYGTTASDTATHAEGYMTRASKTYAHSEGNNTIASGSSAHAEGYKNIASGGASHAEGTGTKALVQCTHAEGYNTVANADSAHAEGNNTLADGVYSHAQNVGTMALNYAETALGQYNANTELGSHNPGTYAIYLGNGTSSKPNNALLVDWKGDVYLALDEYEDDGTKDNDLAWGMDALGWMTDDTTPSIFNDAPMLDLKKLLVNLVEHYPRYLSAKPTFTVNSSNVTTLSQAIAVADGMVICSFRAVNKIQFAASTSYFIGTVSPKPAFNATFFVRCGNVFNIQGWISASNGAVTVQPASAIAANKAFEGMFIYKPA